MLMAECLGRNAVARQHNQRTVFSGVAIDFIVLDLGSQGLMIGLIRFTKVGRTSSEATLMKAVTVAMTAANLPSCN